MKVDQNSRKQLNVGGTNVLVTIYGDDDLELQGLIQWLDSGRKIHFRNAFELLSLLEEAVAIQNNREITRRTWNESTSTKGLNRIV
ncbi:MAG: hypothetical protein BGO41_09845 [Clostridiales bacterium 38-18]|nr:MAG: hypothetical protein BGO41_09845 [Clostridiales bacterium 38-18]